MNRRRGFRLNSNLGSVFVELTLLVPVLLALLYGCIELARLLKVQQTLSTISNESANSAYRLCSPVPDPQNCLNQIRTNINAVMGANLPGLDLIISVFQYLPAITSGANQRPESVVLVRITGVNTTTGLSPNGYRSKFTPPDVGNVVNLFREIPLAQFPSSVIRSTNTPIAISELYYQYQPIGLSNEFLGRFLSRTLYETTIF